MSIRIAKNHLLRKNEIVESARRIISNHGIERLTIREIAKDLKLTDGALYRHFKSKKEIMELLIEDIENTLLGTIESAAKIADCPLEKLENILLSHLSYSEQRKGITYIVIVETLNLHDKTLQAKMYKVIEKYLRKIEEMLVEGVKSGKLKKDTNKTLSSIAFFGIVQSLVTIWALSGYKYSLEKNHIKEIFNIYIDGIRS
ncbi:TetR/AcrR family transcriptional regulator [Candidatus Desantisbacteria bacterium]|nr:TetR/AcrR family transcriptional regulator [Candidatus Desantisbacteria bacterium]